jgi:hypothetical protein
LRHRGLIEYGSLHSKTFCAKQRRKIARDHTSRHMEKRSFPWNEDLGHMCGQRLDIAARSFRSRGRFGV